MKSLTAIGLALIAAASLAGCGSSAVPGVVTAPAGPTTATPAPPTATAPATAATPKPPSPLAKEPVVTPPAGPPPTKLVVKDLITGTGPVAKANDSVTVNYVGVLYKSGKVFDTSWSRHQTFTTDLTNGSVISGWVTGIRGERVGGRRELIIPPNLAYGSAGSPPKIPPNSTLIFVIDLLSVSASSGDD